MSELSETYGECEGCGENYPYCVCDNKPDNFHEPEDFGCCLDDCIMPFPHFESECHNAEMMESFYAKLAQD